MLTLSTRTRASARAEVVPTALIAVVLGVWLVWIGATGGYSQTVWNPSALGLLGLWMVVLVWRGRVLPERRAARVALLAFIALVALNYLSIAWAPAGGDALNSSNQIALYLLSAWIFALLPWTPGRLAMFAAAWSLGSCVFCAVALERAVAANDLTPFFVNGRFATPLQYSNATGALGVMTMWPLLILASRRSLPAWLRGCCLAPATFLATFAALPESRAALLGLVLTAPVALAVMSDRIRLLSRMAVVGGALALCLPRIIQVNDAVTAGRRVGPTLHHTALTMLLASGCALLLGLALSVIEDLLAKRRRPASSDGRARRRSIRTTQRLPVISVTFVGLLVVVAAVIVVEPHVVHLVNTTLQQGKTDAGTGSNRLISTSPEERIDYDRVALHLFAQSPIAGIGSGNFGLRYDALRRFPKHSMYTHDLPLRVLCETGLIGAILFIAMLAALVIGMIQVARSRTDLTRACVGIAFTVSGYFLVHSCLDWVDAFPALAAPAIALPMASMSLQGPAGRPPSSADETGGSSEVAAVRRPRRRRAVAVGGWALAAIAAAVMFVGQTSAYLSLQYTNRAFAEFRGQPQQAFDDLHLAHVLEPVSADPFSSAGTVALYAGDLQRSARAFSESAAREDEWYPRLELALLDAHAGRFSSALAQVNAAGRLDVRDPLIADARNMVESHRRIDPIAFNARIEQEGNASAVVKTTIH
jgi:hypothetical protein